MVHPLTLLATVAATDAPLETAPPEETQETLSFFARIADELGGWQFLLTVVLLLGLGLCLLLFLRRKGGKRLFTTQMLATGAICVALSFVLSALAIFRMPQGGSVTPAAMLPLLIFAYTYGPLPSLVVGLVYGLLKLLQDAWIVSPLQALLDYVIAYMGIALCGLSRKLPEKWGYIIGVSLAGLWRYVCAVLSGVVFFASYAPEGQGVWAYSLGYNSVILVDTAICLVLMMLPPVRGAIRRITGRLTKA